MRSIRQIWSSVLCLAGAGMIALGSVLPYTSRCPGCRILAPDRVSFPQWFPQAAEPIAIFVIALTFGTLLIRKQGVGRYAAGFIVATGLIAMTRFFIYAVHPGLQPGEIFGFSGFVGMAGGALILAAGLLAIPTKPDAADQKRSG